jgi:hypothetical protein
MDSNRMTTSMARLAVSLLQSPQEEHGNNTMEAAVTPSGSLGNDRGIHKLPSGGTGGISSSNKNVPDNTNDGNCLTRLPDVILYKIFGDVYLRACDVVQCSKWNTAMAAAWFDDSSTTTNATTNNDNENRPDNNQDGVHKWLLWRKLLDEEGLPGETFQDLASHIHAWNMYRDELRKNLLHVAVVAASTSTSTSTQEEQQQLCQDFLARTIPAYAWWVCNSQSWYKKLPEHGNAARFGFKCDLRANKRRMMGSDNYATATTDDDNTTQRCQWVDYKEGDGTKFHCTWMSTKEYQHFFGNFCYCRIDDNETPVELFLSPAGYCNGALVPIPRSSLVSAAVCVTNMIHDILNFCAWPYDLVARSY